MKAQRSTPWAFAFEDLAALGIRPFESSIEEAARSAGRDFAKLSPNAEWQTRSMHLLRDAQAEGAVTRSERIAAGTAEAFATGPIIIESEAISDNSAFASRKAQM